eukprot:g8330.t1
MSRNQESVRNGAQDISNGFEANEDSVNVDIGDEEDLHLATDLRIFGKTVLLTDEMKAKAFTGGIGEQSNSKIRKDYNFVQSFDISDKDITNVMSNDGQRHFICCILRYWIEYHKASQQGPSTTATSTTRVDMPEKFVGFLSGVAGGGKSYVLELVCNIIKMLYGKKYGALKVAPTGIAAIACGGNVVDRIMKVQRNKKTFVKLSPASEDLTIRQELFRETKIVLVDEFSMWGKKLLGHFVGRSNELFNDGVHDGNDDGELFGGIPMVIFTGDLKQLQPVKDTAPYAGEDNNASPLKLIGKLAYDSIRHHFILDESVRQFGDKEFAGMLQEARDGKISEGNYVNWNRRTLISANVTLESMLQNEKALFLTPTNAKKDSILAKYLRNAKNIVSYQSETNGRLARSENPNMHKAGMMARIPLTNYFFIGMMVKVTVNIDVKSGLSNGARGVVKDLYFNGNELQFILVDMPSYKGPRLHRDLPQSYCLIGKYKMHCSNFKNWRIGYPLQVGKADTIHSSQGITAGRGEDLLHIIVDGWNLKWENRWPGCFHVAVSRVKEGNNLFFSTPLDENSLANVGKSKAFKLIHSEEQKNKDAAFNKRRADLQAGIGTREDFTTLLSEFLDIVERKWKDKNDSVSKCILSNAKKWKHSLSGINIEAARQRTCGRMMCVCN